MVEAHQPTIIWGPSGCAKSQIAQQVADRAKREYIAVIVDASGSLPAATLALFWAEVQEVAARAASQYDYSGPFREVIMREVQLRDAKVTLSALVEQAARGEATVITRRGKPRAVILGIEEWNRLRAIPSFGRLLLSAPLEDADLLPRDTTPMRDTAL